jgi:tRNA(Ile)-lysidine synthase
LALVAACAFEAAKKNITAIAVVINHNLQLNSFEVAQKAISQAQELGIQAEVISIEVAKTGLGPEGEAREARYRALEDARIRHQASHILLAHNLEDQAETVLMGLARGSGANSLAGMRESSGVYLRPFLEISREQLRTACLDQGLQFWDDPHNSDDDFTRVRIRKLLADLETEIGPGIAQSLSRTAASLQQVADLVDSLASELLANAATGSSLDVEILAASDIAIRQRAIAMHAVACGAKAISRKHVLEIDLLVTNWHGQKSVSVPGITVVRVGNSLNFG